MTEVKITCRECGGDEFEVLGEKDDSIQLTELKCGDCGQVEPLERRFNVALD